MGKGIASTNVQKQLVQDAGKLHDWPDEVGLGTDQAPVRIFNKAQLQRAYQDWTPIDLVELARASKLIALADREFEQYVEEGTLVLGGKRGDTKVENPRGRAISTLNSTINTILRRLGLGNMSVMDKRSQANRGHAERQIRAAEDSLSVSDADLLN